MGSFIEFVAQPGFQLAEFDFRFELAGQVQGRPAVDRRFRVRRQAGDDHGRDLDRRVAQKCFRFGRDRSARVRHRQDGRMRHDERPERLNRRVSGAQILRGRMDRDQHEIAGEIDFPEFPGPLMRWRGVDDQEVIARQLAPSFSDVGRIPDLRARNPAIRMVFRPELRPVKRVKLRIEIQEGGAPELDRQALGKRRLAGPALRSRNRDGLDSHAGLPGIFRTEVCHGIRVR